MKNIIDEAHIETLDADPYLTWIFKAGDGFVQVTNYGGFNEQFDIEVSNTGVTGELYRWEDPWNLVATAYGRENMWVVLKAYIERKGGK
jgi:hypothetical protein